MHMDHNTDAGCKIQDTLCGRIMVMMKVRLVNSNTSEEAATTENGNVPAGYVNHGTKVRKELVEPWTVKGDRVVAESSYFDSVQSSK